MNCCDDYGKCTQGKDCPVRCRDQARKYSYRTEDVSMFDVYSLGIIFVVGLVFIFVL